MFIRTTFLIAAITLCLQAQAQFGTGVVFNPAHVSELKNNTTPKGYAEDLPPAYSLKQYTPFAKNQGQYGTCTAWASAYAALTTQYAKSIGLTNRSTITGLSYCPYFCYAEANGDNTCESGTAVENAIISLRDIGAKKFYLPVIGCGTEIPQSILDDADRYHITEGYILYNVESEFDILESDPIVAIDNFLKNKSKADINEMKSYLAAGVPIIYATYVPMSFFDVTDNYWEPYPDEKENPGKSVLSNTGMHQQHAMCIIGYDDTKYGGAFEILNSWGENWGDNGFTWIRYEDWNLFAYQAYYLEIPLADIDEIAGSGCISGDCANGYGVYKAEGSRYEGHFKNYTYDGEGIYTWPDGQVYAGNWTAGKRQGEGTQYLLNGDYGSCMYNNDEQVSGYAEWTYNNGDTYLGNLNSAQLRDGYGTYIFTGGGSYKGSWKQNLRSGLGLMEFSNGDMYFGEWDDDDMNGMGVLVKKSGDIMAGQFSYGSYKGGYTGYGYADNKVAGAFNKSLMAPQRSLSTADCADGDCIYGNGTRKYSSGVNYEGEFKDGVEDGYGTMTLSDGTLFTGHFKQGNMDGAGRWEYPGGVKYIINYENGKMNGYVLGYDASGYITIQYYEEDVYLRTVTDWITTASTLNYAESFGSNPKMDLHAKVPVKK